MMGGKFQSESDDYDYQRGVLTSHLDYYVINPLSPGRVRRSGDTAQPHVIFRCDLNLNTLLKLRTVNVTSYSSSGSRAGRAPVLTNGKVIRVICWWSRINIFPMK